MRPIRILKLGILAAAAIAAVMATSATAAVPEWGKCVPSQVKAGEYKGAHCLVPAGGKGSYNWVPEPGPKPKFEGEGEKVALETPGKLLIVCSSSSYNGDYTGPKTATVELNLLGCISNEATPRECQTNPLKPGEIEISAEGELGFISNGEKPVVGVDLKPKPPSSTLTTFQCGKDTEAVKGVQGIVEGSVIAPIKPLNHMTSEFHMTYKVAGGIQAVSQFEGGPTDTPSVKLIEGLSTKTEPIGLRQNVLILNEGGEPVEGEPVEIKAK